MSELRYNARASGATVLLEAGEPGHWQVYRLPPDAADELARRLQAAARAARTDPERARGNGRPR